MKSYLSRETDHELPLLPRCGDVAGAPQKHHDSSALSSIYIAAQSGRRLWLVLILGLLAGILALAVSHSVTEQTSIRLRTGQKAQG